LYIQSAIVGSLELANLEKLLKIERKVQDQVN